MKRLVFLLFTLVVFTLVTIVLFWEPETMYFTGLDGMLDFESITSSIPVMPTTTQSPDPPLNCSATGNIIFVKTHKTGSTTVRAILNRYGYFHNLSFLQHKSKPGGHVNSDLRRTPLSSFLPPLGVKKGNIANYKGYNISNTHMRMQPGKLNELMNPGSVYVTILRHPVEQWLSAFQYFHVETTVKKYMGNKTDPVSVFLSRPKFFRTRSVYAWNNQLYDLGLERKFFLVPTYLQHKIKYYAEKFDLVLITEYFDESLILLRKLLCWTYEDIVYVKMRAQPTPLTVSNDLREKIINLNKGDNALYSYFNRTLWQRVEQYGPSFERDLKRFRRVLSEKYDECVGDQEVKSVQGNHQNIMYKVKSGSDFCTAFVNHGGVLTTLVRDKQLGSFNENEETIIENTTLSLKSNDSSLKSTDPPLESNRSSFSEIQTTEQISVPTDENWYSKVKVQCETSQGNIVFIKTHKTGSTSLTAILNRFGFSRNLSFVQMADSSAGHFNYQSPSLSKNFSVFLPPIGVAKDDLSSYKGYNISTVHVRYKRPLMEALMCRDNVFYITILREPVTQLLSALQYFDVAAKNLPPKFSNRSFEESVLAIVNQTKVYERSPFAWNNQLFDLGFSKGKMRKDNLVKKYISRLNNELDLVLIMEYFDESLILLKKLLCWTFEDILYVKRRIQPSTQSIHTQSTLARLAKHNHADGLLYDHFNRTLWAKITEYGPSFYEDLKTFRSLLNNTLNDCVKGQKEVKISQHRNIVFLPVDNPSPLCHDVIDVGAIVQGIRKRQGA
ncbi:uncharacterized protein [Apostichopus japonicus]|uniref:uncharacterized protein n=1 Tax=Stichopus japonicus TaxID=307972 RepID=UPI003AB82C11